MKINNGNELVKKMIFKNIEINQEDINEMGMSGEG